MSRASEKDRGNIAEKLVFMLYCVTMLWLLFGQRLGSTPSVDSINLTPLETIKLYLRLIRGSNPLLVRHAFINLAGNVILFVPLGWFLPRIWHRLRAFWKVFLLVLFAIVLVEVLQLFTGLGSCDVDDLILNVPGAMLGYMLWKCSLCRPKN